MPPPGTRHVVVLDVNVYLDVARYMGAPFKWARMSQEAAKLRSNPHLRTQPGAPALLLAAACSSGRFAGSQPLEVWTSSHIAGYVHLKACEPAAANRRDPGGLGWTQEDADLLLTGLVDGLTSRTNGGTVGELTAPTGNPPLDHEDGMVFGAACHLGQEDLLAEVYCVTSDTGFLEDYEKGRLPGHVRVLPPERMLALLERARFLLSTKALRDSSR